MSVNDIATHRARRDYGDQRLWSILTHLLPGDYLISKQTFPSSGASDVVNNNGAVCGSNRGGVRPRIAAIVTTCFPRSHGDVILTKLIKGMSLDEQFSTPRVEIVSLWIDCIAATSPDVIVPLAAAHDVVLYPSIRRALLHGTDKLNVDGVLVIGEHGDYPNSETGREMHPRRYFTEQILGTFAETGRSVPIFNDKHLAYSWADAAWMWDRAETLGAPLMAGSSIPLAWRSPWLEHPKGVQLSEAIAIGYSAVESYGFHALEGLQCMVERRAGGESGVVAVQCIEGRDVWAARDQGRWPQDLAEAALSAIADKPRDNLTPTQLDDVQAMAKGSMESATVESLGPAPGHANNTALFVLEYADGFRGFVLMLPGFVTDFAYAARVDDGTIEACVFNLHGQGTSSHFSYLARNIEEFFMTGISPYPGDDEHPPERPYGPAPTGACLDPLAPDENWTPGGSRFQSDEWANRILPAQPNAPVSSF